MTTEEILKEAIKRAMKNGFLSKYNLKHPLKISFADIITGPEVMIETSDNIVVAMNTVQVILSPGFAKAYWGEEWKSPDQINQEVYHSHLTKSGRQEVWNDRGGLLSPRWQYHEQQMVILPDDERIKYIGKFL